MRRATLWTIALAGLIALPIAGCGKDRERSQPASNTSAGTTSLEERDPLTGGYPRSAEQRQRLNDRAEALGGGYFHPPERSEIPDGPLGESIRRGERIFRETDKYAGDFTGNDLQCAQCHIDNGRRADSAPMWAAWTAYPAYREKNGHVNTMEERIRGCFTYSMNAQWSEEGRAPEPGDPILVDLEAYVAWLATDAPTGRSLPGRGFRKIEEPRNGWSLVRGEQVYATECALCHGANGEGKRRDDGSWAFPPLWGAESYNWGAGMHRVNTAAGFIKENMPLGQPNRLTVVEAYDVAAYINSKPRPGDPRFDSSVLKTDETFHEHSCQYGETVAGNSLGKGVARPAAGR